MSKSNYKMSARVIEIDMSELSPEELGKLQLLVTSFNQNNPTRHVDVVDILVQIRTTPFLAKMIVTHPDIDPAEGLFKMYCELKADPNTEFCNFTPLAAAVYKQFPIQIMDILLQAGADINRGKPGFSPLCLAIVLESHYSIIEFLLKNGADPDNCKTNENESLIIYCIKEGKKGIYIQKLLEHGANPLQLDKDGKTLIMLEHENKNRAPVLNLLEEYKNKFVQERDILFPIEHQFALLKRDL